MRGDRCKVQEKNIYLNKFNKNMKKKPVKKSTRKSVKKAAKPKSKKRTVRKVSKKTARKTVKKATRKTTVKIPIRLVTPQKPVGKVTHFYNHIKVAIVKFNKEIPVGATVRFKGATTEFTQRIDSMQYDHQAVKKAPKGKLIGIKVAKRVREHDQVLLEK